MNNELKEISKILKKIEEKMEDKTSRLSLPNIFDFAKMQEDARKEREEKRKEEILCLQKNQSKMMAIQTNSIKRQEDFNKNIVIAYMFLVVIGTSSLFLQILINFEIVNKFGLSVGLFVIVPIGFISGYVLYDKVHKNKQRRKQLINTEDSQTLLKNIH